MPLPRSSSPSGSRPLPSPLSSRSSSGSSSPSRHLHVLPSLPGALPCSRIQPFDASLRFLELCVTMRKAKIAKDGLGAYRSVFSSPPPSLSSFPHPLLPPSHLFSAFFLPYRNVAQSSNVPSIELVIKKFLGAATAKVIAAQASAASLLSSEPGTAAGDDQEEVDLDAPLEPSTLLLMSVDAQRDRTDRQVVLPALRFLWECIRVCLETLRNSARLEIIYQVGTSFSEALVTAGGTGGIRELLGWKEGALKLTSAFFPSSRASFFPLRTANRPPSLPVLRSARSKDRVPTTLRDHPKGPRYRQQVRPPAQYHQPLGPRRPRPTPGDPVPAAQLGRRSRALAGGLPLRRGHPGSALQPREQEGSEARDDGQLLREVD